MKFIIFIPPDCLDTGYFYGDDDLELGFATSDLDRLFGHDFDVGVEPWPTFLQSCTILAEATIANPAEVQLLFPELFI